MMQIESELSMLYPCAKIETIPVVMTSVEWHHDPNNYKRFIEKVEINKWLQAYMQYDVLKKTFKNIVFEFKEIKRLSGARQGGGPSNADIGGMSQCQLPTNMM